MTNGEKIRLMNDNELAELISSGEWSCICPFCKYQYTGKCRIDEEGNDTGNKETCTQGALEWLSSNTSPEETKELTIYNIDDCEYWISDLSVEETARLYCEEYGLVLGEDIKVDEIEECDLDNDGMYWNFETMEIDLLIKALLGEETIKKLSVDGNKLYIAKIEGTCIWVPFRRAIELDGLYKKPHMIACTEW